MSTSVARPLTLIDLAAPRSGALSNALLVIVASLLTAGAAQLEWRLPWTPVPITGQTFAVLLTGAVLGARRAFLAQCLYLLEGASGLPFFAGGAAGLARIVGPTGGYLVAFPFAAAITGMLAEQGWDRRPATMFLAMLTGSVIIFVLGLAHLSSFVAAGTVFTNGLFPFIPGDVTKSLLAAGAFPAAWKLAAKLGGRA